MEETTINNIYMCYGYHNARVEATNLNTMTTEVFYGYDLQEVAEMMQSK